MKKEELKRDVVVSMTDEGDLVGVYWADEDGSSALFECPPEVADKIIKIWNDYIKGK